MTEEQKALDIKGNQDKLPKYQHKKKYVWGVFSIEEHEYLCPDGSVGLLIYFWKITVLKTYLKIVAFGKESARGHDWKEVFNAE